MNRVEILPDLWIATTKNANNKNINQLTNIKSLINCENDLSFLENYKKYNTHISQNLIKYNSLKLHEYLLETTNFIKKSLESNKPILLFCDNATQKSPIIAAAYLVRFGNLSKVDAINSIKSKYSKAFYPEILYESSLDKFCN